MVFEQCRSEKIRVMVMVCWMIWKSRNDLVWKQRSMEVEEVVQSANSTLNQ